MVALLQRVAWLLLFAGATLASTAPAGKDQDHHIDADRARSLFRASAFLHGYMHGYEEGFHCADQDIHMGRPPRPLEKVEHSGDDQYRKRFGERRHFLRGFAQGLRVGYADGIRGVEFRAVAETRKLAEGLEAVEQLPPARRKIFESGVMEGYELGLRQGLLEGRSRTPLPDDIVVATAQVTEALPQPEDYKSGFARGYRLGYTDGYLNQAPEGSSGEVATRK